MGKTVVRLIRVESKMGTKANIFARAAVVIGAACVALCVGKSYAVFFDFRGLNPSDSNSYHLSAAGIGVQISADVGNVLKSTTTTFGIDSNGLSDDPNLFDGGNGSAEALNMIFDQPVFFESIQISQFGAEDSGRLEIVTAAGSIPLTNGVNNASVIADKGNTQHVRWTGANAPGTGRGFSVDGFTVRLLGTVPAQSGDYNNNGVVDADDFVVWRKTQGNSIIPFAGADGDGDGIVNAGDYSQWRQKFGKPPGSGAEISSVPEVPLMLLFVMGAAAVLGSGRRHAKQPHVR
jgi:hypothetical protein